jgi:transposase
VVSEELRFARAGSRFTRAFEDTCVWLVRDAPKTVVSRLMRIDWATIGRMLERVVAEASASGDDRLAGLRRIGIDEVSYRKGRRYLLCVVCHETGRIVWAAPGKSRAVLHSFFDELGEQRCALLEAVSADLQGAWPEVIRARATNALICADPFHVVKLAGDALDTLRRQDWQRLRKEDPRQAVWLKGTRFVLRRRADSLSEPERTLVEQLAETNERVYRGWLLVDQLRAVYQAEDAEQAILLLDQWLRAARASMLIPFLRVAGTLAEHREGIVNAIVLGLSNARLEAMNSTVRLISHRSRGFRRLDSLLAMIRLVCGKVPVALPT